MPSRVIPLVTGEYYHLYNRGVAKAPIFLNQHDLHHFLRTVLYYQADGEKKRFSRFFPEDAVLLAKYPKIVDIICYCFMPNHYHFLLKQNRGGGISEFLGKIGNSYTKYINTKNHRNGPLLQGAFKAKHLESDEQLVHLSRYIHLNPLVGYTVKSLEAYRWSSYLEYIGVSQTSICTKEVVLGLIGTVEKYKKFVEDQVDYARQLEYLKHIAIDAEI